MAKWKSDAMRTAYTYANKHRALAALAHYQSQSPDSVFALVLETCYPSGRCDEEYIVSFYQPLEN
jgi:hypothetical protein